MSRVWVDAIGMITFEERIHPTHHTLILQHFSKSENWLIEVRETLLSNLAGPFTVHRWTLVFDEGVVCEGQIGDIEEAKRYAEIAYNAFRAHLGD